MDEFEEMLHAEIPAPTYVEVAAPPPPVVEPEPTPEPEPAPVQQEQKPQRAPRKKAEGADKTPIYLVRGDNGTLYNKDAEDMEIKFRSDFAEAVQEALRKTVERRNRVRYLQDKLGLK